MSINFSEISTKLKSDDRADTKWKMAVLSIPSLFSLIFWFCTKLNIEIFGETESASIQEWLEHNDMEAMNTLCIMFYIIGIVFLIAPMFDKFLPVLSKLARPSATYPVQLAGVIQIISTVLFVIDCSDATETKYASMSFGTWLAFISIIIVALGTGYITKKWKVAKAAEKLVKKKENN